MQDFQDLQDLTEKKLSSKTLYKGKILEYCLDQVESPNGKEGEREVILHNGGVVIIPRLSNDRFILVRQFRYAINKTILEFPAGRLNSKSEEPEKAALRELIEETGYKAEKITHINSIFTAPGFCSEVLHIYLAEELSEVGQNLDPDEFVNLIELSRVQLESLIKEKEIQDAKTLAAWAMFN